MDEKVLNLLIERVEMSASNYQLHKNDSWKKCLEDDKNRLKEYCLKQLTKSVEESKPISDNFRFMMNTDPITIFTATRMDDKFYKITWESSKGRGVDRETCHHKNGVDFKLKSGDWYILN